MLLTAILSLIAGVQTPGSALFEGPTWDRWMYPFNPFPGVRTSISTFGTSGEPDFDNRDGQLLMAFDTSGAATPGLGVGSYRITQAVVTVQNNEDVQFVYDDTQDPYTVFLDPGDEDWEEDADPGQPLELYGVGYRGGFGVASFGETSAYTAGDPLGQGIRNAFAIGAEPGEESRDVSLNVVDRFDPVPWAIGLIDTVPVGQFVPIDQLMDFTIDVDRPDIQQYFAEALDGGQLNLAITSLTAVEPYGGSFPSFYSRENPVVLLGLATAARLELEFEILEPCPEDLDSSGAIDFGDVVAILGVWGVCGGCPEDLDGSGVIDFGDVLLVLAAWGPCP